MKNDKKLVEQILRNAERIDKLNDDIERTHNNKLENPDAWRQACKIFHASYDALAFPGGLQTALESLRNGDEATITTAISFLKADPFYFRSGYNKQKIVRLLKQTALTQKQISQLQEVLVILTSKGAREFREYCRLAHKIATDEFRVRIEGILRETSSPQTKKRAEEMLKAITGSAQEPLITRN